MRTRHRAVRAELKLYVVSQQCGAHLGQQAVRQVNDKPSPLSVVRAYRAAWKQRPTCNLKNNF